MPLGGGRAFHRGAATDVCVPASGEVAVLHCPCGGSGASWLGWDSWMAGGADSRVFRVERRLRVLGLAHGGSRSSGAQFRAGSAQGIWRREDTTTKKKKKKVR